VRSYRPSLPPSPGRRLFFLISAAFCTTNSPREIPSIRFIFFCWEIPFLFFASVATSPDPSPGHGSTTAHCWLFCLWGRAYWHEIPALGGARGWHWVDVHMPRRTRCCLLFFFCRVFNAMGTRNRAFGASYSIMESDVRSVAAARRILYLE
jgi:hypothetical protein